MKQKISLVIIEDNQNIRNLIKKHLLAQDDIEVLGAAENGVVGIDMIKGKKPDVVLLDMFMPRIDGLEVLERINALGSEYTTQVICLSAVAQENLIRRAVELGAKDYILKPFDAKFIVKRIREIAKNGRNSNPNAHCTVEIESPDEKISKIFLLIGIPAHIRGYHFLREAIKIVVADTDLINRITKELYPKIAKKFDTTPSKVERAIRHAIDMAWNRGKATGINQVFGCTVYGNYDKPTNGEFIALVADKLSIEHIT